MNSIFPEENIQKNKKRKLSALTPFPIGISLGQATFGHYSADTHLHR